MLHNKKNAEQIVLCCQSDKRMSKRENLQTFLSKTMQNVSGGKLRLQLKKNTEKCLLLLVEEVVKNLM